MNINNAFPSNYLKCADLQGRTLRATIKGVQMEELGKDSKPVLYFQGKQKGVVLNKTKSMTLADAWGPETDGWVGREVSLRPTRVAFEGRMTDAIAVEPIMGATVPLQVSTPQAPPQEWRVNAPQAAAATTQGGLGELIDDDVPF